MCALHLFQGLKCKRNDPDSVVFKQLDNLYGAFVTFHGSLNSLRLVSTSSFLSMLGK